MFFYEWRYIRGGDRPIQAVLYVFVRNDSSLFIKDQATFTEVDTDKVVYQSNETWFRLQID